MSMVVGAPASPAADPQHPAVVVGGEEPETYASAMRMIRDELRAPDSVRTSGDFTALARRIASRPS